MAHKKVNLAQKICPVCQRSFSWRKKWEKDWEQVIYCSEKCRRSKFKNDQPRKKNQPIYGWADSFF